MNDRFGLAPATPDRAFIEHRAAVGTKVERLNLAYEVLVDMFLATQITAPDYLYLREVTRSLAVRLLQERKVLDGLDEVLRRAGLEPRLNWTSPR